MNQPLWKRRKLLKEILPVSNVIRFSYHIEEKGSDLFELSKDQNIEGILAKNRYSTYKPDTRSNQSLKIKT